MTANPFLSVLATGISGCARLHEKLGGSEAARAVDRCLKRIERAVEAGGGRIVRVGGDEVLAAFDAADAVVHAAIEMQQRIADLPPVSGVKMAIRVGISCGHSVPAGSPAEDELAREAARLAGVAKSGQILSVERIRAALPEALRVLAVDEAQRLPGDSERGEPVVEIALSETSAADAAARAAGALRDAGQADGSLRLRYGGDTVVLDERRPVVDMGRDGACDLVIRDRRASRRHATIKRRGNLFVLVDRSTNGTYVTIDGDSEQFVKHGECTLYGSGVIAFAASSSAPDADCAEFECT